MTTIEIDQTFSKAMGGGETCRRELRLTQEEAEHISAHYAATLTNLGGGWYQVQLTA